MPSTLETQIRHMPKVELHVHLEGSIGPDAAFALFERNHLTPPAATVDDLAKELAFRDFDHFLRLYLTIQDAIRTPEDIAFVVYKFAEDRAAQNIIYSEVTFTPYTHVWQNKGLAPEDLIAGLEEGRRQAREAFGVTLQWVLDIPRGLPEPAASWTTDWAIAWQDRGVVALGLGGPEAGYPPEPFAEAFSRARAAGLRSAPHAGEMAGPDSVWGAIHALAADRIGHGIRAVEDPLLLTYLRQHQIPLEVNPTSNVCLKVYPSLAHHPFPHLWRMGLYLTVNSDDPPLFNTTLTEEFLRLADTFNLAWDDIRRLVLNAAHATFLPTNDKQALVQRVMAGLSALEQEGGTLRGMTMQTARRVVPLGQTPITPPTSLWAEALHVPMPVLDTPFLSTWLQALDVDTGVSVVGLTDQAVSGMLVAIYQGERVALSGSGMVAGLLGHLRESGQAFSGPTSLLLPADPGCEQETLPEWLPAEKY